MKNTLHFTLINTFILLILFSLNVKADNISDKVSACNQAIEKGEFKASLNLANEILKLEKNNRDGLLCKGRALGAEGNYKEGLNALELAAKNSQAGLDEIIAYIFIANLHKKNQQYIIILLQNTKVTLNNKNMCTFTLMNKTSLHITSLSRTNRPTTSPEVRMLSL